MTKEDPAVSLIPFLPVTSSLYRFYRNRASGIRSCTFAKSLSRQVDVSTFSPRLRVSASPCPVLSPMLPRSAFPRHCAGFSGWIPDQDSVVSGMTGSVSGSGSGLTPFSPLLLFQVPSPSPCLPLSVSSDCYFLKTLLSASHCIKSSPLLQTPGWIFPTTAPYC